MGDISELVRIWAESDEDPAQALHNLAAEHDRLAAELSTARQETEALRSALAACRAESRDDYQRRIDAAEAAIVQVLDDVLADGKATDAPLDISAELARVVRAIRINVVLRERAEGKAEALRAENEALRDQTCARHADQKHGAEAEELRRGIEQLLNGAERVANGKRAVGVRELQKLLDDIDARDSLAYLESRDEKLAAAIAEIERLTTRRDELLALVASISQSTPLDEEVKEALNQRGALLAEVGTLRSQLAEVAAERDTTRAFPGAGDGGVGGV